MSQFLVYSEEPEKIFAKKEWHIVEKKTLHEVETMIIDRRLKEGEYFIIDGQVVIPTDHNFMLQV